jgi:DNA-binding transcriptional regulator of glucitol operon
MWHLLTIGAMVTCSLLAAWQWHRAGSAMGSALNIGYGLQWPVFALFFGYMWWRMLSMEVRRTREESLDNPVDSQPIAVVPVPTRYPGPSPFGPRPAQARPVADEDDPEMAAYNRMLAELAGRDND